MPRTNKKYLETFILGIGFALLSAHATVAQSEAAVSSDDKMFNAEPSLDDIRHDLQWRDRLGIGDDIENNPKPETLPPGQGLKIEVYKGSRVVGKQFVTASLDGEILQVFAVSSGREGHETPSGGPRSVVRMLRSHNSSSYPSQVGNNMDFAIYFRDVYALHATLPDGYPALGRPASHGCVRLVRPSAELLFNLVNRTGRDSTRIYIYGEGANPPAADVDIIREKLGENFALIRDLIRSL